jgi:poly(beta-D-mannuronate) lyase
MRPATIESSTSRSSRGSGWFATRVGVRYNLNVSVTAKICDSSSRSGYLRSCRSFVVAAWIVGGLADDGERCQAADFFVATPTQIAAALSKVQPGDTVIMRNGKWQEADILFDPQGTAKLPITLRAETPGKVVISGESRLRIGGKHLIVDGLFFRKAFNDDHLIVFRKDSKQLAEHCRLTNCAIVDCNVPDAADESRWISLYGRHNRIDHCWIEGKRTKGTTVAVFLSEQPAHHRIDRNHFGPRPDLGKNGGETIRVGDSNTASTSARVVVENNLFEACSGEAEIISSKSCDNIYRWNTFLRSSGALTLRHGHRCTVSANFFLGEKARGTGGVRIIGRGHRVVNNYFADLEGDDQRAALSIMKGLEDSPDDGYEPVNGAIVAFNTFVNCKQTIVVGLTDEDADLNVTPQNCTIANNLIVSRRPAIDLRAAPRGFVWQGNLLYSPSDERPRIAGIALLDKMPLVKDEAGLWRPTLSSPAIDAAIGDYPWIKSDIDGQPRDDTYDVGCDELAPASAKNRPLQQVDVGPGWKRSP